MNAPLTLVDGEPLQHTGKVEGFRCLGNNVLLQVIRPGGMIELPENYTPDQTRARVLDVGPGVLLHTGERIAPDLKAGDCVLIVGPAVEVKLAGWKDVILTDAKTLMGVVLPDDTLPRLQ